MDGDDLLPAVKRGGRRLRTRIIGAGVAVALAVCSFGMAVPRAALADDMDDTELAALAKQLYGCQFDDGESIEYSYDAARKQTATDLSVTLTALSAAQGFEDEFEYVAYLDPVTGKEVKAGVLKTQGSRTTWQASCSGLKPGTEYDFAFCGVYTIGGQTVRSRYVHVPAKTTPLAAVTPKVTKLASNRVQLRLSVPSAQRQSKSFQMRVYAGSALVKKIAVTSKASYTFVCKKAGAAKKKYTCAFVWAPDASVKASSAAVAAKANVRTWKRSSDATAYGYGKEPQVLPTKLSYTSKGKLRAKVLWVNTALSKTSAKLKIKVTLKVNGKKVAGQTFTSKKIKRMATKKGAFTFKKAKKYQDLRNGEVNWTCKLVSAK